MRTEPSGQDEGVTAVSLPIDVRSVAAARAHLHDAVAGLVAGPGGRARAEALADAALMVSELVTNAVRHTRGLLRMEIHLRDSTLHVAVVDDAPGSPVPRAHDDSATNGRGLTIVDALADDWGFTATPAHKTTWFTLRLPERHPPPADGAPDRPASAP